MPSPLRFDILTTFPEMFGAAEGCALEIRDVPLAVRCRA